jgi:aminopeptidase N
VSGPSQTGGVVVPMSFSRRPTQTIGTAAKTRIIPMTTFFSQKFGEYPFEKIGFATLNNLFPWGGMENQTLISLCTNCWTDGLMSHEFAHMWFGDAITCGTWADVWLNEGFATYCEALWIENTTGYTAYKNRINNFVNNYFAGTIHLPIYNPSWAEHTPGIDTLYDYGITYCKGACVLHMLRYTIGDSLFFSFLNAYATDTANFKNKNAVTDDFTDKLNQVAGQDLTWFIDEWVKQPYHPVYANTYAISSLGGGNWQVSFVTKQTQSNTPFHKMPIQVKITFASGPDSTIRVMNDVNNQEYYWTFDRQPSTVTFDPGNDIVLKQGGTTIGIPGAIEIPLKYMLYQNYPNPFNPVSKITFDLPEKSEVTIKVYDVIGRLIKVLLNETKDAGSYSVTFNGTNLPSGVYYYEIKAGNYTAAKKMALIK